MLPITYLTVLSSARDGCFCKSVIASCLIKPLIWLMRLVLGFDFVMHRYGYLPNWPFFHCYTSSQVMLFILGSSQRRPESLRKSWGRSQKRRMKLSAARTLKRYSTYAFFLFCWMLSITMFCFSISVGCWVIMCNWVLAIPILPEEESNKWCFYHIWVF